MAANFLVYHKLGNVGFLGFSGAASFQDTKPYFQEAGSRKARTRAPRVEPKLKSFRDMNDIIKHTSTIQCIVMTITYVSFEFTSGGLRLLREDAARRGAPRHPTTLHGL